MGNNSVLKDDPLGDTLEFPDNDLEFINQFFDAVSYLNENGAGEILSFLMNHPSCIAIVKIPDGANDYDSYSPSSKIIYWNPNYGGFILSPATRLNHEADHVMQDLKKPGQFKKDTDKKKGADKQYQKKGRKTSYY